MLLTDTPYVEIQTTFWQHSLYFAAVLEPNVLFLPPI